MNEPRHLTPRARPRRSQGERSLETVSALVGAARRMFALQGYAGVSLDEVCEACGMSRGALYHHFCSKAALFEAVFEREESALAAIVVAASAKAHDPWQALRAGCHAFLDACLDPDRQRIILVDAPSVLDWKLRRAIEGRYVTPLLEQGLVALCDAGIIERRPVGPLRTLLLGALAELAMEIAQSDAPGKSAEEARAEVDRVLAGLKSA